MITAPIATILYNRFGAMKTVMAGNLLATLSLSMTALVNSVFAMVLVYSVCYGLACMMIVNPPFFLLNEYFPFEHPRHVLATSIVACAFPLGTT